MKGAAALLQSLWKIKTITSGIYGIYSGYGDFFLKGMFKAIASIAGMCHDIQVQTHSPKIFSPQ